MINLLPKKNKDRLKKDALRRFVVVGGLGLSCLIFVVVVFASVFYLHMNVLVNGLNNQLELTKNFAVFKNLEELETKAEKSNALVSLIEREDKSTAFISDDVGKVLDARPYSIKLDSFVFEKGGKQGAPHKLVINGNSLFRKDLLDFIDSLKTSGYFNSVTSPVSNLLKERDVDFTLSIELKQEQ